MDYHSEVVLVQLLQGCAASSVSTPLAPSALLELNLHFSPANSYINTREERANCSVGSISLQYFY